MVDLAGVTEEDTPREEFTATTNTLGLTIKKVGFRGLRGLHFHEL